MGIKYGPFDDALTARGAPQCGTSRLSVRIWHMPGAYVTRKFCQLATWIALAITIATVSGNPVLARSAAEQDSVAAAARYLAQARDLDRRVRARQELLVEESKTLKRRRGTIEKRYAQCQRDSSSVENERIKIEGLMREAEEDNRTIWGFLYPQVEAIRFSAEGERMQLESDHYRQHRGSAYAAGMERYRNRMKEYQDRYFVEVVPRYETYEKKTTEYLDAMDQVCSDISDLKFATVLRNGWVAMAEVLDGGSK